MLADPDPRFERFDRERVALPDLCETLKLDLPNSTIVDSITTSSPNFEGM